MYKIITEKEIVTKEVTEVEVSLSQFIGHRITQDRVAADINIRQLTDRLNKKGYKISTSTMAKIEKGNDSLRLSDLEAIGDFFGRNIIYYLPSFQEEVDSLGIVLNNSYPQTVE
jgi:transcriptional regulator with XRE-family HTH domain